MASTAKIVNLADHRQTRTLDNALTATETTVMPGLQRLVAQGRMVEPDREQRQAETSLDDLYGSDAATEGAIYNVRRLLSSLDDHARTAHTLFNENDVIGADNEISLLLADLPELFVCGSVSDGLDAVIVALYHGLRNLHGKPLTLNQIYAVKRLAELLRSDPFLNFNKALDVIDSLIDAGIQTDPIEANVVGEHLAV